MTLGVTPLQLQTMRIHLIKESLNKNIKRTNNPRVSEIARKVSEEKTLDALALLDEQYKAKVERMIHLKKGKKIEKEMSFVDHQP